jgi:hypothetical protein
MIDQPTSTNADRERRKEELLLTLNMERIQLEPWYLDIRSEIVKPDQVQVTTKYFWSRWAPKLGPLATCLLLRLRQYCYYNRVTGEKRDWCYPSQQTLANELGIQKRHTIGEALRHLEALGFVRREPNYRYDASLRKKVRTTDRYLILMEDPIAPADEPEAFVRAAERMLADHVSDRLRAGSGPTAENRPKVAQAVENLGPMAEKRPYSAGRKTARKSDIEEVLGTLNVSTTTKERVARSSHLAAEILAQLGDSHSMGFYRKVVQVLPEQAIHGALSEVKDARLTGRLKGTAGAYFTYLVKLAAREIGVEL